MNGTEGWIRLQWIDGLTGKIEMCIILLGRTARTHSECRMRLIARDVARSMVGVSVCLMCWTYTAELCKNGWTDSELVWDVDFTCVDIMWVHADLSTGSGNFDGGKFRSPCLRDYLIYCKVWGLCDVDERTPARVLAPLRSERCALFAGRQRAPDEYIHRREGWQVV